MLSVCLPPPEPVDQAEPRRGQFDPLRYRGKEIRLNHINKIPVQCFESLADDAEDGSDDPDGVDEGTLRDSRTFVPPHVFIKKEEQKHGPEVGWRSLINE